MEQQKFKWEKFQFKFIKLKKFFLKAEIDKRLTNDFDTNLRWHDPPVASTARNWNGSRTIPEFLAAWAGEK